MFNWGLRPSNRNSVLALLKQKRFEVKLIRDVVYQKITEIGCCISRSIHKIEGERFMNNMRVIARKLFRFGT